MTNGEFAGLESSLLYRALRANSLTDGARRHLQEGYARRLILIQTNRETIFGIAHEGRTETLTNDECAELNVHLNSYYVQLRGALDNLAWAVHYQLNLLGEVDEDAVHIRRECYLFDDRFLRKLDDRLPQLARQLRAMKQWADEFKELRDPVAHRIPLYAVPGVAYPAETERIKALYAEAADAAKKGDRELSVERWREARAIGGYQPIFVTSRPTGLQIRKFHEELPRDHAALLLASMKVFDTLGLSES